MNKGKRKQMDEDMKKTTMTTDTRRQQNSLWFGNFFRRIGPFTFVKCIEFILLCMKLDLVLEGTAEMMAQIVSDTKGNTTDFQTELNSWQFFADIYNLLLFILIIDQDKKEIKKVDGSTKSEELPCAFIVYDKDRREYFPLSMIDKNSRKHTIFCHIDDYISDRWKELVQCVNQSQYISSEQASVPVGNRRDGYAFNTQNHVADPIEMQYPFDEIVTESEKLVMPPDLPSHTDMLSFALSSDPILHTNTSGKTQETSEFRVEKAEPDGSCLFTSVRRALGKEEMSNGDLRRKVVNEILQSDTLINAIHHQKSEMSPDQYCNWIKKSTSWGGEIELRAMALLYKILFCVVNVTDTTLSILRYGEDLQNITQCIYLLYTGNNHYDLLYLTKKDNPNYKETTFCRDDVVVQAFLQTFLLKKYNNFDHSTLRWDNNSTIEPCEYQVDGNCTMNDVILSNSTPRKSSKRKRTGESNNTSTSRIDSITTSAGSYPVDATPKKSLYELIQIDVGPCEIQRCRQIKELTSAGLQGAVGEKQNRKPMKLNIVDTPKEGEFYLFTEVLTRDGQPHPSKIILPKDTKLNLRGKTFSKNAANKLEYIEFAKNSRYKFDPITKRIYFKINKPGLIDISIRMVRLYQNQDDGITKELIEKNQLYLSKLAFWISKLENKDYVPVSSKIFSNIIREASTDDDLASAGNEINNKNVEIVIDKKQLLEDTSDKSELLKSNSDHLIQQQSINTLNDRNWLNDEIINFYLNLVARESGHDKYPRVYAFDTFFYEDLIKYGPERTSRFRRIEKIDFFNYDLVLIPIHLQNHWTLATLDFSCHCISYYDSLGHKNNECLELISDFVEHMYATKKPGTPIQVNWTVGWRKWVPQQKNGSDCGVFICQFAKYLARRWLIDFTQENMPQFRQLMIEEITSTKLIVQSPSLSIMPLSCST